MRSTGSAGPSHQGTRGKDARPGRGDGARVLVLTGAGASAESGIPTFRDKNGLWENHRFEDVATPEAFARDPRLVWRFYSERRRGVLACAPNPTHTCLALLEQSLGDRMLLVTQNVDGLHQRAGSRRLIELHGNLGKTRCSRCAREPFDDSELYIERELPRCEACAGRGQSSLLRPHIVWFGELLEASHLERISRFLAEADGPLAFIAVGTSGAVYPAAGLVHAARTAGAETWLVNRDPADNAGFFDHVLTGPSGTLLPELLGLPA